MSAGAVPGRRPPDELVGVRFRTRPENLQQALASFAAAGFEPIFIDYTSELGPSIWFGKTSEEALARLISAFRQEWSAIHAILVGDRLPFTTRHED
ncbi:hypothetical protein [uncultured Sphingomonas sp.]|uniref:hypothetical protein n=1 Tax=uncultured Sphingomonas sp. TaxID=158754 RepID=UPI0035CA7E2B